MSTIPAIPRITLVREVPPDYDPNALPSVTCSDTVALHLASMRTLDREHFRVLLLDSKNRILGENTVSVGTLSASLVHPREVLRAVLISGAASFICAHNHPSGDPQPSEEDRAITGRLKKAAELMGVCMLDHIIIGMGSKPHYSFADDGWPCGPSRFTEGV